MSGLWYGFPRDALAKATAVRADVSRWRARAQAALDALRAQPGVDRTKLAAIGYCFGGTTVLEMARRGQDLNGVVSFHGALETEHPAQPGQPVVRR